MLKVAKKSKNGTLKYNWGKFSSEKSGEIFSRWRNVFPTQKFSSTKIFPHKVFLDKVFEFSPIFLLLLLLCCFCFSVFVFILDMHSIKFVRKIATFERLCSRRFWKGLEMTSQRNTIPLKLFIKYIDAFYDSCNLILTGYPLLRMQTQQLFIFLISQIKGCDSCFYQLKSK